MLPGQAKVERSAQSDDHRGAKPGLAGGQGSNGQVHDQAWLDRHVAVHARQCIPGQDNEPYSGVSMARREISSLLLTLMTALLLGILCLAAGFLVVGMGHGWGWPQRSAIWTLLLYPLTFGLGWAAKRTAGHGRWFLAITGGGLLAIGVMSDRAAWTSFNGTTDGANYARLYPGLVLPWLVLWLGWQLAAAVLTIRALPWSRGSGLPQGR